MNCDFMFSIEQFFISAESLTGPLWSNSKKTRQFFGTVVSTIFGTGPHYENGNLKPPID